MTLQQLNELINKGYIAATLGVIAFILLLIYHQQLSRQNRK